VQSLTVELNKDNLQDLRLSPAFQTLRHQVAETLRQLDGDPH
jgi:hypothetical protein